MKIGKEFKKISKKDIAGLQHLRHRNANFMAFAAENGKKKAECEQCRQKGEKQ